MIVVDTSALIAIFFEEPERERFSTRLARSPCAISSANLFETHMVLRRRQPDLVGLVDEAVSDLAIDVRDITAPQLAIARVAFDRYGKGMGHPAQLTFGDCFAYALSKSLGAPLLFKGEDFARTDVTVAIY